MKLPDKLYDILKWIAVIVIPALCVLISTVFKAWGLPYAEPISTTVAAIGLFIGALIGVSTAAYNKDTSTDLFIDDDDIEEDDEEDDDE